MDELKAFLKGLLDDAARERFASDCGASLGHLRNVMYGIRPCSPELAAEIEARSGRMVRRWHLRPFDWYRIWPELRRAKGAPVLEDAAEGQGA